MLHIFNQTKTRDKTKINYGLKMVRSKEEQQVYNNLKKIKKEFLNDVYKKLFEAAKANADRILHRMVKKNCCNF